MAKMMTPKGKKVSGKDYAEEFDEYEKKRKKKLADSMKTAGLAKALKKADKEEGYSNKPRVIPQKKKLSLDLKKGKVI